MRLLARLLGFQRLFLEDCVEVGDLASASKLLGVSVKALERLALKVKGVRLSDVACTKEARRTLKEVLEAVGLYARTSMAKHAFRLTVPSLSRASIEGWRRKVEEARRLIKLGPLTRLDELLKRAEPRPLQPVKLSVALALRDRRLFEEASLRYGGLVDVELVDSVEKARSIVELHDVTVTTTELRVEEPGVIVASELNEVEVVPHLVVGLYASWLPIIESGVELAEQGYLKLNADELEKVKLLLDGFKQALTITMPSRSPVEDALDWVEEELAKAKPEPHLLTSLAEEALKRFKLSASEAEALEESVSHAVGLPLPRLKIPELRAQARRRKAEEAFNGFKRLARNLLQFRGLIKRVASSLVELDKALATARFMEAFNASWADVNEGLGLGFIEAKNLTLLLKEAEGGLRVQPVSYAVGNTSIKLLGSTPQRVVLLTGANSGGKTTLLQTIAQLHLMTLSGLPVPARKAEVPLASLYLLRRRTARSIGSLEYAIKRLKLIFTKPGAKLILMDEFEAITEPGAMGRIMAALLNHMPRKSITILVTHLAREIIPHLKTPFRVDGIEAKGIDERGELIVDRQPILNHLGLSSPELVVERLKALTSNRRLKKVYDEMLTALKAGPFKSLSASAP